MVSSNFDSSKGKVFTKWFSGGETNICYNAVDRHVEAGHGDQIALYHEANDEGDDVQHWTYKQVLDEVSRVANVLKSRGVKKGDRVTLFMPMVPHLPIAMLACARIGAVHSVVFGGFSAEALANRIVDADSSVVVTANGVMRGKKPIGLNDIVNKACTLAKEAGKEVTTNLILNRLSDALTVDPVGTRDIFWEDVVPKADAKCDVEWVEAEHPLFVLYTAGSTGKPKGVLHTTGGTWWAPPPPRSTSSTCRTATLSSAPPTAAGAPATRTSRTALCSTARPSSSSRACRRTPTAAGCGGWSTNTR